ncbi:ABC transporter permease [Calditerrivibrio sp.]|uniref:ABC transporter permease n=1 Tax=Calditerrivibrio sp. TaxID=2792612 RepID=UPI003D0C23E2
MVMIKFILIFQESLKSVLSYRLRSFLSILSIALGIIGVTLVVGAVNGAYQKAGQILSMFGPDSVLVFGGTQKNQATGFRTKTLTFEDLYAIRDAFPTAYILVPMSARGDIKVSYKGNYVKTFVVGSTEGYSKSWTWDIYEGSDFSKEDVDKAVRKCLLGSYVKDQLFLNEDPIGKYIYVNNFACQVSGVLEERGISNFGVNINDRVIIPITVLSKFITGDYKYITAMRIRFEDVENLNNRIEELRQFLRYRHNLGDGKDDDFTIVGPGDILKFFVAIGGALIAFLTIITLITVSVGGFVMANLFLISVTERTKEIGIRRALGATKRDIFLQFIFEFFIITLLGAIVGFFLGSAMAKIISSFKVFEVVISLNIFFISIIISGALALIFGVAPAKKASEINPITAIRS